MTVGLSHPPAKAVTCTLSAYAGACLRPAAPGAVAKKRVTFCPIILERVITPESREAAPLQLEFQPAVGSGAEAAAKPGAGVTAGKGAGMAAGKGAGMAAVPANAGGTGKEAGKKARRKNSVANASTGGPRARHSKEELRPTKRQNKEILSLIENVSVTSCDLRKELARRESLKNLPVNESSRGKISSGRGSERCRGRGSAASEHQMRRDAGAVPLRRRMRRPSLSPEPRLRPRARHHPAPKPSDPPISRRHLPKSASARVVALA